MGKSLLIYVCLLIIRKSIAKRVLKVAFIGKCSVDFVLENAINSKKQLVTKLHIFWIDYFLKGGTAGRT